jgi:thiol:disulfide interchange protein
MSLKGIIARFAFTALLFLAIILPAIAQMGGVVTPVKFKTEVKYVDQVTADLIITANIDDKWHLYSQYNPEGASLPTVITFTASKDYQRVGVVKEWPKPTRKYEELFGVEEQFFYKKAIFTQRIIRLNEKPFKINVEFEGQACIEQCVLISEEFEFEVKGREIPLDPADSSGMSAVPMEQPKDLGGTDSLSTPAAVDSSDKPSSNEPNDNRKSLWLTFILAFGIGLVTLVTPCVFPVIPMTVSFFMHGSENRRKGRMQAMFYGISIVLIYTIPIIILTALTAFLGSNLIPADFANTLSTHWIPNVIFFFIFIIFAASFFGAFEIVLPSWMVNKADAKADKGGYVGAFFMALTLVIVSFSCTGPLVGTIIVQSLGGLNVDPNQQYSFGQLLFQYGEPTIGMLGFSLGVAIPFTVFALFPGLLSNMPKSGGWLNVVKVVLGFIELALAFKFLSVSDQAYHWGILDREIYIAIWVIISILLGMYLLGKLKFRHDSEMKYLGTGRLSLALIAFVFAMYLFPGMFGAPLKALSGYLPPMHSHDFDLVGLIRDQGTLSAPAGDDSAAELCEKPKYAEFLHLPHGLNGYYDYEQGMECARKLGKPVFIDFTGHGCVNCREMEANVWSDPRVLKKLQNNFIVIALYVDDKTSLPEEEWYRSRYDGKMKKTVGKKYADFQIARFGVNAQPYYVLLDHDGKELTAENFAYKKDVDAFLDFLNEGLAEFAKRQSTAEGK